MHRLIVPICLGSAYAFKEGTGGGIAAELSNYSSCRASSHAARQATGHRWRWDIWKWCTAGRLQKTQCLETRVTVSACTPRAETKMPWHHLYSLPNQIIWGETFSCSNESYLRQYERRCLSFCWEHAPFSLIIFIPPYWKIDVRQKFISRP